MNDKDRLYNLAAVTECTPSSRMDSARIAKWLRALASTLPDDQDTFGQEFTDGPIWEFKTVVSNALPSRVFIFTAAPPTPGSPPSIVGTIMGDKTYGAVERAHHMHVSSLDVQSLQAEIAKIQHERKLAAID